MLASFPAPGVMAADVLIAFAAGVVRGFAGFGFSALCVAGLTLFASPSVLVPAVMSLEVFASLSLLRSSFGSVDRSWLVWLVCGSTVMTPIGLFALATMPELPTRLLVGAALLLTALALRAGMARTVAPSPGWRAMSGGAAGILNGLAASGGVAAAMLMTATGIRPAPLRATMIAWLLFAGIYGLLCAALVGGSAGAGRLLDGDTLRWMLLLGPSMFAGIWLGRRSFGSADPLSYRRFVLDLLILVSSLSVLRAGWQLAGSN